MDIFVVFKGLSFLLSVATIVWGFKKLTHQKAKLLFIFMIFFFFLSTVLSFPEGTLSYWFMHIPFYSGQILFYLFLSTLIKSNSDTEQPSHTDSNPVPHQAPLIIFLAQAHDMEIMTHPQTSPPTWFDFLTDHGFQHIVTLPFLLLIVILIRIQYAFIASKQFKSVLNIFMLAEFALIAIHIGKFAESQGWVSFLTGDQLRILEFVWYFLSLFLFGFGVKKLSNLRLMQHS